MQRTINRNTQLQQKDDNQQFKNWLLVLSSCLFLSLSACSTLPKQQNIKPEYAYDIDTKDTSLAKIINPLKVKIQN